MITDASFGFQVFQAAFADAGFFFDDGYPAIVFEDIYEVSGGYAELIT